MNWKIGRNRPDIFTAHRFTASVFFTNDRVGNPATLGFLPNEMEDLGNSRSTGKKRRIHIDSTEVEWFRTMEVEYQPGF